uniref:Uncharacterized protein n=1 Tax=Rhizobium rhizogenes TaxID=359 RepID=A0A7S4ZSQ3_RHIRH|nr:hypothetical protein pC6.5b_483 [Rhizobium rhizogenes]
MFGQVLQALGAEGWGNGFLSLLGRGGGAFFPRRKERFRRRRRHDAASAA